MDDAAYFPVLVYFGTLRSIMFMLGYGERTSNYFDILAQCQKRDDVMSVLSSNKFALEKMYFCI